MATPPPVRLGWAIALAIVALGVFHFLTLRPGQDWGDDFAQYVAHARNLAWGQPYDQTGYVVSAACPTYAPRAYPPLLPLMLAPIVRVAGLNFEAMKWLLLGFLLAGLGVIDLVLRRQLAGMERLAIILLIGLNPYLYRFKNSILSDLPFLFLVYATVWWSGRIEAWGSAPPRTGADEVEKRGHSTFPAERADRRLGAKRGKVECPLFGGERWWLAGLGLGVVMALAYATRVVGVVLPVALLARDLWVHGKPARTTLLAVAVMALLAGAQALALPPGGDYAVMLALYLAQPGALPGVVAGHACAYAAMLAQLWQGLGIPAAGAALAIVSAAVALAGYAIVCLRGRKRGVTLLECFVPLYLAAVLVWPVPQDMRFVLPIVPAFFYYAAVALRSVAGIGTLRRPAYGLAGVLAVTALTGGVAEIAVAPRGAFVDGATGPAAEELCVFIRGHIPPEALLTGSKPRALALFTGRPATPYPMPVTEGSLAGVRYAVVGRAFGADRRFLLPWLSGPGSGAKVVFDNGMYQVLALAPALPEGG